MNLIDIIIIVLLLLGVLGGYRRGFFGSLANLLGSLVGLIVAAKYYPVMAQWLNDNFSLQHGLDSVFKEYLILPQPMAQLKLAKIPTSDLGNHMDKLNLPAQFKLQLLDYLHTLDNVAFLQGNASLDQVIQQFLASAIVTALAFILIWLLVNWGVMICVTIFKGVTQNTVLGGIDRMGGAAVGLLLTAFTLTIIMGLINPVLLATNMAEPSFFAAIFKTMGEAKLLPYFMEAYAWLSDTLLELWV